MPEESLLRLASAVNYPQGCLGKLPTAVTHKSFANEAGKGTLHNERLEFLGDAVLGLLVAEGLMAAHPEAPEGTLSRLRASLVNARSLAEVAGKLGIGDCLRLGRGEDQSGGRRKDSLLADAYEAVLGAAYLDNGLEAARALVEAHFGADIRKPEVRPTDRDYKTRLQEAVQAEYACTPVYRLVGSRGPDHAKEFLVEIMVDGKVWGIGTGRSKKAAERAAASEAWRRLD